MKTSGNVYITRGMNQVARMISMQDREPFSRTHGCFDRTYWGWKFTDFPGARFQEGIYSLAWLFSRPAAGKQYYCSEKILNWARAGMEYWRKIQYRDGSFDEAYPFERSLAATAFTSFYTGEAFLLLQECLHPKDKTQMREAFVKAGNWLCVNDEHHGFLSNHLAVAAASLYVIHMISGEEKYRKRCEYFVKKILDHQSREGWYEEYGGADPGYQTHGMFYLARLWQHTRNESLLGSLENAASFLKYCFHPDGTLGGEYGSRNTEFYFPAGFEILSEKLKDAADIAVFMRPSVEHQAAAGLGAVDPYNFFPLLNNYFFAADNLKKHEQGFDLPFKRCETRYFPAAGIYFKSNEIYYAVCGVSKGGTLRVHDQSNGRLVMHESGYWAGTADGKIASSQNFDRGILLSEEEDDIEIKTRFYKVGRRLPSPWLFMGFRFFSLTFGRIRAAAYYLKNLLVRVLIRKKEACPLELVRRVRFENEGVFLSDKITRTSEIKIIRFCKGQKFSVIHMGSSRYFQDQELNLPEEADRDWADEIMRDGKVEIEKYWKPTANENQEIV